MRAAIYARYSAGPNQTEVSIDGQVKTCLKYIKEKGYTPGEVYADEHISGKTDRRPQFQQMISDAEAGHFDVVIVYSTDRFSRGQYDLPYYRMVLNKAGVKLESAAEHIPEGPEGILLQSVLDGLSIYYSLELSRKIKRGMMSRAEKGIPIGGPTPFGYRLKDKSYVVDPDEAAVLSEIFDMIRRGETMAECARYLNRKGFRTNKGNRFNPSHMKNMLTNIKYTGVFKYGDIEIEGAMPQIIEKEVFEMVQESLKDRKHAPRGDFALTGKLLCGKCGSLMRGTSGTSKTGEKHYYYKCNTKDRKNIRRDDLESLIAEHIRELLMSPQELDMIADKVFALQEKNNAQRQDKAPMEAKLKKLSRQIDKLLDEWLETDDPRIREKMKQLGEQEKDLQEQLVRIRPETDLTKEEIKKGLARNFGARMTDAEICQDLVQTAMLYDDHVDVVLNLLDGDEYQSIEFDLITVGGPYSNQVELSDHLKGIVLHIKLN